MIFPNKKTIKTQRVRIEASTVCQLKCPSCPTASGEVGKQLGLGYLKLRDFKSFVKNNVQIVHIELSNWGEIFLNKELIDIIRYAYKHNISLSANGVNLNNVHKEVLMALVKYKIRTLSCSIDGASQQTYSIYRVNGNFRQVINNIKIINEFKDRYRSQFPVLRWQFIAFGHNEHEINKAKKMAKDLNMDFYVKLNWEDLWSQPFSPVKNSDLIKKETGLDVSNRDEFVRKYGFEYLKKLCCLDLWNNPQINYDGRMLGCSVNFWDDYGNAFKVRLEECLNHNKIKYAREMLKGIREETEGIPCAQCNVYRKIKQSKDWITDKEITEHYFMLGGPNKRIYNMIEGKILGFELEKLLKVPRRCIHLAKRIFKRVAAQRKRIFFVVTNIVGISERRLTSGIYRFHIPLKPDFDEGWKPFFLFKGISSTMKSLSCHVSVLIQGLKPHPPHEHKEEEILLLLNGEVDITFSDKSNPEETQVRRLKRGDFVYYPSNFSHTLQTVSEEPANYMMYKWHAHRREDRAMLKFGQYNIFGSLSEKEGTDGFDWKLLFEGPTAFLNKLHCHVSTLAPQAGYEAHVDDYDVSIVLFEGEVETLGKRVGPNSVIYYAAGEPHGMYNPGKKTAKYLVFEFHGHPSIIIRQIKRFASVVARIGRIQRY